MNEEEKMELQPEENSEENKKKKGYEEFLLLHDLVYMLAIITVIFVFFFRLVGVDGSSMYPTFMDKDLLILESNFIYRDIDCGDIVVMNVPAFADQGPIVKCVIATEGQTVDIDFEAGDVFVDGQLLDEPYIFEPTYESYEKYGMGLEYPVTVPEGHIFVMGDNRNNSADSRYAPVGCVDEKCVLGKVLFLLFPGAEIDEDNNVVGNRAMNRIGVVS
ncbi:MAG: signal peptidase I [Oscillospiraceae bacterium]|nr:signal peptidase I [Oscillospiraceae bacterium]